jgi:hypothetical protein
MKLSNRFGVARTSTPTSHTSHGTLRERRGRGARSIGLSVGMGFVLFAALVLGDTAIASAAQPTVQLGTTASFAVLAGSTVTNTGPSTIQGSLGLAPGSAVTGFPPGHVSNGSTYVANAVARQAKVDLTTAYLDAAGRTPFVVTGSDLGGRTLAPGVYRGSSSLGLTGTVTLNGHGDASAVFIFQAGSTLITASSSTVRLENGAQACNVFWQVGSSATLGTSSSFVGTIMALTSISLNTGVTVDGRVLARNGAVTLQNDRIAPSACSAAPPVTTTTTTQPPTKKPPKKPTKTPIATKKPPTKAGKGTGTGPKGTIPRGAPQTGDGGASDGANAAQLAGGFALLFGALAVGGLAVRRRRATPFVTPQRVRTDGSG